LSFSRGVLGCDVSSSPRKRQVSYNVNSVVIRPLQKVIKLTQNGEVVPVSQLPYLTFETTRQMWMKFGILNPH